MKEAYIELVFARYFEGHEVYKDFGQKWLEKEKLSKISAKIIKSAFSKFELDFDPDLYKGYFEQFLGLLATRNVLRYEGDDYSGQYFRFVRTSPSPVEQILKDNAAHQRVKRLGGSALTAALNKIHQELLADSSESRTDQHKELQAVIDSTDWTGVQAKIDSGSLRQIKDLSESLIESIRQSDLDVRSKENAIKHVEAAQTLMNAPDPAWQSIVELLNSPSVIAFLTAIEIIKLIIGAAS